MMSITELVATVRRAGGREVVRGVVLPPEESRLASQVPEELYGIPIYKSHQVQHEVLLVVHPRDVQPRQPLMQLDVIYTWVVPFARPLLAFLHQEPEPQTDGSRLCLQVRPAKERGWLTLPLPLTESLEEVLPDIEAGDEWEVVLVRKSQGALEAMPDHEGW